MWVFANLTKSFLRYKNIGAQIIDHQPGIILQHIQFERWSTGNPETPEQSLVPWGDQVNLCLINHDKWMKE